MANTTDTVPAGKPAGQSREWNYHPDLPISMSPVFDFPPRPKAAMAWLLGTWLKLTPPVNHLLFAVITYVFLWPPMATMQQFTWQWMVQIFAINLGAVLILAGSMHLYLHTFAGQATRLKFDIRPMGKSPRFTFGNQIWDNMFWTLASGVPIWTIWTILYFYTAANEWVPRLDSLNASPVWFVAMFFVIRFWQSFHFYWIHRLLHLPWLFKGVHHLHHRNINVGPWTGLSMHPIEHLLYYSGILIHFVLPSHPLHVLFHLFALNLGAIFSHAGFNKVVIKDKETINAGSFHHQLHHRYFECNYGTEEVPLDTWFDSFHDGTVAANKRILDRKKQIMTRNQTP